MLYPRIEVRLLARTFDNLPTTVAWEIMEGYHMITSIYAQGTTVDKTPSWDVSRNEPKPYVTSAKWLMAPRVQPSRDNTAIPKGFKVTLCKAVRPMPSLTAK